MANFSSPLQNVAVRDTNTPHVAVYPPGPKGAIRHFAGKLVTVKTCPHQTFMFVQDLLLITDLSLLVHRMSEKL